VGALNVTADHSEQAEPLDLIADSSLVGSLRMYRRFLRFQFSDQFVGPVKKGLIEDPLLKPAIPRDRSCNLLALLTHDRHPVRGDLWYHLLGLTM